MKQFFGGVLSASIFWAGLMFVQSRGAFDLFGSGDEDDAVVDMVARDTDTALSGQEVSVRKGKKRPHGKRRRGSRGAPMQAGRYDTADGVAGDDLGTPEAREVSMGAGAEDQLSNEEIDRGIDRVFNGIQRCLLLLPPDAPAKGKVVFGMHIASSGQVTKVSLKGPNVMIQGECGACFRRTVKSIRFRSFDGPDMIVHYPVAFD
jgi:hypothetical protein